MSTEATLSVTQLELRELRAQLGQTEDLATRIKLNEQIDVIVAEELKSKIYFGKMRRMMHSAGDIASQLKIVGINDDIGK